MNRIKMVASIKIANKIEMYNEYNFQMYASYLDICVQLKIVVIRKIEVPKHMLMPIFVSRICTSVYVCDLANEHTFGSDLRNGEIFLRGKYVDASGAR